MNIPRTNKVTAAVPGIAFGPQRQCGEEGGLADGGPGIERFLVVGGKIDQQSPVRRKVAAALVNPSFEPLPFLECIILKVPLDHLDLFAGTPAKDYADRRFS